MFFEKVNSTILSDSIRDHVPPGSKAIVIHDGIDSIDDPEVKGKIERILDARFDRPEYIADLDRSLVIIYACTQDDLGLPFVKYIHESDRKYFPVMSGKPGGYVYTNTKARNVLANEFEFQKLNGFAKWDFGYQDFSNLIQALEICRDLPGCYLEVGCFRGSSAGVVLRYLRTMSRPIQTFFFDVFRGFTYEASKGSSDAIWHGTHITEGLDSVRRRLLNYTLDCPQIEVFVEECNIITDPLPMEIVRQGIKVANLDVDLHEAVYAGLHKLAPHIVKNGILIVEDPGHTPLLIGAKYALSKFLAEDAGKQFIHIVMESGQSFLIKK
jgi:hypothetical protein